MVKKTNKKNSRPTPKEREKKLADARALMIMVMPHFVPLLSVAERRHKIAVSEKCSTACTYPDGRIVFGADFLDHLDTVETAFLIAHELGHHYMGTFSRVKNCDKKTHELVNIASDTQINNMVAQYFEAHNYSNIRTTPCIKGGQWWEPERFWWVDPEHPGISCFSPLGPADKELTLENLSRELLPSGKFQSIDKLSMEDIVAALEIFSRQAEAACLEKKLKYATSLGGNVICKQDKAFPFSVVLDGISPEGVMCYGQQQFVFKIKLEKVNPSKKDFIDVIPRLTVDFKIHSENRIFGETADLEFSIKEGTFPLAPGSQMEFDLFKKLPGIMLKGNLSVIYGEDGTVQLDGTVTFFISADSSLVGQDGQGSGDVKTRGDLKELDPSMTDEEIDRSIKEMEQARRQANSIVSGNGTAVDVEVRAGLYNVPWQAYLQTWIDGHSHITRTYNRASRRGTLPDPRCVLPGHARSGYCLNILLDTSGSMQDLLPAALGAIAAFCERSAVDMIKVIECDQSVEDIKEITPEELRKYSVKGGGGTEMTPGMLAFMNDQTVTGVIVITDGEFDTRELPPMRLPYDVLWCLVGSMRRMTPPPPYGKQVHLKF